MGLPQSNQQTGFIGYPTNQIYNQQDQQYMLDTQRQFLDWGNWQPGMTRTNQFMPDPSPDNYGEQGQQTYAQNLLNEYYQRVGSPYEQSQRQGYWQQMGGQNYGGVLPPRNIGWLTGQANENPGLMPGNPWSDLNSMGISSAYGMPAWQQAEFASQNATPGGGQDPMEQFSLQNSGSLSMSNYGIPASFNPVTPNYSRQQAPPATSPSPWGNNNGSRGGPWGDPSNWGSQNYMWG